MTKYILPFLFAGILLESTLARASSEVSGATTHEEDLVRAGDLINGSFGQNSIKKTGRSWDLAISGNGFFPLQNAKTGEIFYTRLGRFELGRDGYIILAGHPYLRLVAQLGTESKTGPLHVVEWVYHEGAPAAGLTFEDEDGDIRSILMIYSSGENVTVGKLVLAQLFNNGKLREIEPHIFKADAAALPVRLGPPMEKGFGRINVGALEQL